LAIGSDASKDGMGISWLFYIAVLGVIYMFYRRHMKRKVFKKTETLF